MNINNSNKTYTCTVNWGSQTSTDDTEGEILLKSNKLPKINEILSKLPNFIGKYKQTPPKVSAVKVRGQRAYKLARKNINFEILPKEVEVSKLEVVSHEKFNTTFIINCGKGFYIRSFARDLGRELQTYGHISFLERTNVGKFDKKSSILLDDLLKIGQRQLEINCIISSISMLDDILAYEIVDPDDIKNLSFGRSIKINENSSKYFHSKSIDKKIFFLSYKGNIVSIGKLIGNLFKPDKVLI